MVEQLGREFGQREVSRDSGAGALSGATQAAEQPLSIVSWVMARVRSAESSLAAKERMRSESTI